MIRQFDYNQATTGCNRLQPAATSYNRRLVCATCCSLLTSEVHGTLVPLRRLCALVNARALLNCSSTNSSCLVQANLLCHTFGGVVVRWNWRWWVVKKV